MAIADSIGRAARGDVRPLVFEGVTVVDVQHGALVVGRRAVIGNRIATVDKAGAQALPADAQMIDGRGKYLILGLWDMHAHMFDTVAQNQKFLASGITDFRDRC